jgi:hypothetical protein
MQNGSNPYAPPRETSKLVPRAPRRPKRNILLEIVQAFSTIVGILIGWILIGAGQLYGSYAIGLAGIAVIVLSCMIGRLNKRRGAR